MCGIAGVFGAPDRETVRAMLATLAHRGPDDERLVARDACALGARRLSIMDVQRGSQPVSNESRTVWAAHNGEIYNFLDCARDLRRAGHTIETRCDTEILPHLYEEHGADLAAHVDGMFAFAVWDDTLRCGVLARDRIGKKPLYYHVRGDRLYFASEIKALLRIPGFENTLNLEAVHHFLSYKHVPHPLTMFHGIAALPPAHVLVYRAGAPPAIRRYWDVDFSSAFRMQDSDVASAFRRKSDESVDQLLDLLRDAVARRLTADVEIGFFLSGGIDSSLVTALAAESSPRPLRTFTLTYANGATTEEKEQDRRWAGWVAARYGTDHTEVTIDRRSFPDDLRSVLRCFDEPFAGVVSTWFLARDVGKQVRVALSGDGADELFGSYLSHRLAAEQMRVGAELARPVTAPLWQWRQTLFVFRDEEKAAVYAPDVAQRAEAFSSGDRLRRDSSALSATDPLNEILEVEFRTQLPDQVLAFTDRLSMAHALEIRSPFLDTAFVRFAARLPGDLKIRDGETKYLLKQAARRYFPSAMVNRRKEGFVMPVGRWMLDGLSSYVHDTLSASRIRAHGLFRPDAVDRLVTDFYGGQHQHTNKILSLLAFQEWHDLYKPCLA